MERSEKWVSMAAICEHLGFSKDTIKKMIREKGLPAYKPDGKIWKFKISEVDAWMRTKRFQSEAAESEGSDV